MAGWKGLVSCCEALARGGYANAEPDVEAGSSRSQDHVTFPRSRVLRNHQGQGDARGLPGRDFYRGCFQSRHGIAWISRERDLRRGVSCVRHVQGSHRVAVPGGG